MVNFTNRKPVRLPEGGKEPIDRIMAAYGFTSRLTLCNHLSVSQSTMANRIARGNFPADWVLICAMETNAALEWLTFGQGPIFANKGDMNNLRLEHKVISNGNVSSADWVHVDVSLLPQNLKSPFFITFEKQRYVVEHFDGEINDGLWLIEFDGLVSVRELYRFPGGRVRIENGKASFECAVAEIKLLGKVISKTEFME
ncbi:phage repressor protein CI [Plesiomonas sp.]|uniref:phage repressor protein CI n=1 Tax=Plesiomonas sp. TaxID=2486279 RepID=UPI003F2E56BE